MTKLLARHWIPISLAVCFTASLLLRILPPYNQIFTDLGIKFAMNDAYYHMRLIDSLVYNFPHFSFYDPYFVFPGTTVIGGAHFFDWLVADIVWIIGLGSPTQATIDIVGVCLPPILAALLVIPVYFIGKSVFNKWVGIVAALLIAILPGEFLGRSILGAADHHVAEVLFSTTAIMLFILAIKSRTTRWTRIFTILAGVFLGVYLLTWLGGLLFILSARSIICSYRKHHYYDIRYGNAYEPIQHTTQRGVAVPCIIHRFAYYTGYLIMVYAQASVASNDIPVCYNRGRGSLSGGHQLAISFLCKLSGNVPTIRVYRHDYLGTTAYTIPTRSVHVVSPMGELHYYSNNGSRSPCASSHIGYQG